MKRTDIRKILIIGAGPIVIGQGCEFDYSGVQAVKVLKREGYEVVLVNSNPATVMTDPGLADSTYIEPLTVDSVAAIIRKERPDAVLPTLGGQTALNVATGLAKSGVLAECGVEMIGANAAAIARAEDRNLFKAAMSELGLEVPRFRSREARIRPPRRSRLRAKSAPGRSSSAPVSRLAARAAASRMTRRSSPALSSGVLRPRSTTRC